MDRAGAAALGIDVALPEAERRPARAAALEAARRSRRSTAQAVEETRRTYVPQQVSTVAR